jgi:hypothetical protein
MSEFTNNLISVGLAWLLIGSVLWALISERHIDFVVRRWTQRRGVLPGNGVIVLSVVLAIVKWPVLAAALWRRA